ncbi:MAG: hypothetical protein RL637_1433 [Pseudomonadota bacterium]|jgi:UDP-N-acetylmuramoylalanine--D-glutamate ligase
MDIHRILKQQFNLDQNSKIVIVGLGITGLSVAKFLDHYEFQLTVIDSRHQPPYQTELRSTLKNVPLITGHFAVKPFNTATHLIISPGLSLQIPIIQATLARGVQLISDVDLFAVLAQAPIIAITGANGKSTVTTMVGEMAKAAGKKTAVGGNLGIPVLDLLADDQELYVLELSSFQLERSHLLNATAATVLNISADHLDRHTDIADYAAQKQKIFRGDGVVVLNADDQWVSDMQPSQRAVRWFSLHQNLDFHVADRFGEPWLVNQTEDFMPCRELPLEGKHNWANALAALALGESVGLDKQVMCQALRAFVGLDHRMQKVATKRGIHWINDSKATNIGACAAALEGYDHPVILLAGGQAKGADMTELRPVLAKQTKAVILMGVDALSMARAFKDCVSLYFAASMTEAVKIATEIAQAGDTVLLSPACASLDQYQNYQHRGEAFASAVHALDD